MTTAGWIFLMLAWAFILGLVGFCFRKILAKDNGEGYRD